MQGVGLLYFNMEDPTVGGYSADKVALRRAIGLAMNAERTIQLAYGGQGFVAHSPMGAHVRGFDAAFRSENGQHDPARAKALLDTYGYLDRDGDGWRELPDGQPLVLAMATESTQITRQQDELFQKDMEAVGLNVQFRIALWQENLKAARAGKLMMWRAGLFAGVPDGTEFLVNFYGPSAGSYNLSRFRLPEMDALYERIVGMPDGEERDALFERAKRIAVAYMPHKTIMHRVESYMSQPWVVGFRYKPFLPGFYHMVDIDDTSIAPAH